MSPPIDQSGSAQQSQSGEEDQESMLPPGWTEDDFNELVEKVYQLLLTDLTLECERGAW